MEKNNDSLKNAFDALTEIERPTEQQKELYFEVSDIEEFYKKLQVANIEYVHDLLEHNWGQRVVRFYDPDHHIIEVAEDISMVVKRFFNNGMTIEQVAERMDVPVDYVKECLEQ